MNKDIYVNLPWNSVNEYYRLAMRYKKFGGELAKFLKTKKKPKQMLKDI